MNDKNIDDLLNLDEEDMELLKETEKKVMRGIQKNVYSRVIKGLLVFVILIVGGYFGISKLVDFEHYNPFTLENIQEFDEGNSNMSNKSKSLSNFDIYLNNYIRIFYPGYSSSGTAWNEANKAEGFGDYTLKGQIHNLFHHIHIGGINFSDIKINKSNLQIEGLYYWMNQFYDVEANADWANEQGNLSKEYANDTIERIKKMPESAIIDVCISFDKRMSIENYLEYEKLFDKLETVYIATQVNGSSYFGFSTKDIGYPTLTKKVDEAYPYLYLKPTIEETYSAEQLRLHYTSMLQFMIDNQNFSSICDLFTFTLQDFQDEINRVNEEGLTIIGIRAYVSRDDAIRLLENDKTFIYHISDAKFSEFER